MTAPFARTTLRKIVTITNQKGGVGKTTISYHLAHFLNALGFKVLLVDMDGQGNLSSCFLPPDHVGGLMTAMLFDSNAPEAAPVMTGSGVDLIYAQTSDIALYGVDMQGLEQVETFYEKIQALAPKYDFVVLDSPPSYGVKMIAACVTADHIFAPIELAGFSAEGVLGLKASLDSISKIVERELKLDGLICNKFDSRSSMHALALEAAREDVGDILLKTIVRESAPIDAAIMNRQPVWAVRKTGSQREASKMFIDLMKEIAGRVGVPEKVYSKFGQ